MALTDILGTDTVKDALKVKVNAAQDQVDTNTTEIQNGRDGEANILAKMDAQDAAIAAIVAGNVAWTLTHKTSSDTLTAANCAGTLIFTNKGASGEVNLTLPAGVAGYRLCLCVMAAQTLKVTADGTETFRHLGTQTSGGGYLSSNIIGHYLMIEHNSTEWIVTRIEGHWTDGTTDINKKSQEFIPVEWGKNGANPPTAAEDLTVSNQTLAVRKYPHTSTDPDLLFPVPVPNYVTGTTIKFRTRFLFTESTPPSNEGVAFALQGYSLGAGDALGGSFGTAVVKSITGRSDATNDVCITGWSDAITVTNMVAGELALLKHYRDFNHADNTYSQDVAVFGIDIDWKP